LYTPFWAAEKDLLFATRDFILLLYMYSNRIKEKRMLAIRLPEETEKRLAELAKKTGRTKTFYAREAIEKHLEDLEDIYLGLAILERVRSGEEEILSSEDVWNGLDD
jgi:RHH-type rel operon transcriptional repressor/antitoxin RelB